jgi:hypothetical protein
VNGRDLGDTRQAHADLQASIGWSVSVVEYVDAPDRGKRRAQIAMHSFCHFRS